MSNENVEKLLTEIRDSIKGLQDSYILRQPTMLPKKDFYLYAFYGGSSLDRVVTLSAGEIKRLLLWEGASAFLFTTLLSVTMPDATLPYIGYVMEFDRGWAIADWTIEEYNTELGLIPGNFISNYGGCLKYDSSKGVYKYVSATMWEFPVNDRLSISLENYTDVEVDVAIYDLQLYSYGHDTIGRKIVRESLFPYKA